MIAGADRARRWPAGLIRAAIEGVWRNLESGKWKSEAALREACGADDATLIRIINFLTRWEFVDTKRSPELLVRRKPGSISPLETFEVLSRLADGSPTPTARPRFAERVACGACGSRELGFVGVNEVECNRCHEKQWYTIVPEEKTRSHARSRLLDRVLIRFGLRQRYQDQAIA
jgi:hypothetical protein